jgi:ATP-dependent DNA helicase RecQ
VKEIGGVEPAPVGRARPAKGRVRTVEASDPAYEALKRWRRERAVADGIPAYVVFHDSTLSEIAGQRPRTLADLRAIPGVGPAKLERYGDDVLGVLAAIS